MRYRNLSHLEMQPDQWASLLDASVLRQVAYLFAMTYAKGRTKTSPLGNADLRVPMRSRIRRGPLRASHLAHPDTAILPHLSS